MRLSLNKLLITLMAMLLVLTSLPFGPKAEAAKATLADGTYTNVFYRYLQDGTMTDSASNGYLYVERSGVLTVENGKAVFSHEIKPSYYELIPYLGFRLPGEDKAVINGSTLEVTGKEGYADYEVEETASGNVRVSIEIEDLTETTDILMHVFIPLDHPESPGVKYDHWYNVQLWIDLSNLDVDYDYEAIWLEKLTEQLTVAQSVYESAYEGPDNGNYPYGSKTYLLASIEDAEEAANNPDSSAEELEDAYDMLIEAVEDFQSLMIVAENKRALKNKIDEAAAFVAQMRPVGTAYGMAGYSNPIVSDGEFPDDSITRLSKAITTANTTFFNNEAAEAKINSAATTLTNSLNNYGSRYYTAYEPSPVYMIDSKESASSQSVYASDFTGTAVQVLNNQSSSNDYANIAFTRSVSEVEQTYIAFGGAEVQTKANKLTDEPNAYQVVSRAGSTTDPGITLVRYKIGDETRSVYVNFNAPQLIALGQLADEADQFLSKSVPADGASGYDEAKAALTAEVSEAKQVASNLASVTSAVTTATTELQKAFTDYKAVAVEGEPELTNETIPNGEYEVDFTFWKDNEPGSESISTQYMKIPGSKGTLIAENGTIWFEHDVTASNLSFFEYLGYRPEGADKTVISGESVQGLEQYIKVTASNTSDNAVKRVRYEIADIRELQDLVMHINIPMIGYNHWYNVQLYIDTDDIKPPVAAEELYYTAVHASNATFSSVDSYFEKPAQVKANDDGTYQITLTLNDSSTITNVQTERNGVFEDASIVSEDTEANKRNIAFNVDELYTFVLAKVSVSVMANGQEYKNTYDVRLNLNGVDNTKLLAAYNSASSLLRSAVAGTGVGQYPEAAKTALTAAVAEAGRAAANGADTQAQTDAALTALQQAIETFKAAVITETPGGTDPGTGGGGNGGGGNGGGTDPGTDEDWPDGFYYIDFEVFKDGTDETSIANDYFVSPAILEVAGGKYYVTFTVLRSAEITSLRINGKSGTIEEENTSKNTRVVRYQIPNLTDKHDAKVKIDWDEYNYHHSYDIQFFFDEDSIEAAGNDPTLPDEDGNIDIPDGVDPEDLEETEVTEGTDGAPTTPETGGTTGGSNGESITFTDTAGHWAADYISQAVALGIVNGYADGSFNPNGAINRGEFITMISRALKLDGSQGENAVTSFADGDQIPAWASEHALFAVNAGLIGGYEDGSFRAGSQITRAELAVIIARAAKLDLNADQETSFTDQADIPAWASKEVAAAAAAGLITGKDGGQFAPNAQATRAEAVTMIIRLLDLVAAEEAASAQTETTKDTEGTAKETESVEDAEDELEAEETA